MRMCRLLRFTTFLILCLYLLACSKSTPKISSTEAEQTMEAFFTALSEADTTLLRNITTDDFTLYEHELVWNTDSLLALMPYTQGRIWTIHEFESLSEGDVAHVHYRNISEKPEGRSWLESALLVNENNQVKIKFMHSTKLYLDD